MPATSATEIANLALLHLGQPTILSIDPPDNEEGAQVMAVRYESARKSTLRDHVWNFATKRSILAEVETPPFGWERAYALPSDCLRAVRESQTRARFKVELNADNERVLVADEAPFELIYIADVSSPALMDDLFVEAFAAKLAASCALRLTGSTEKLQAAEAMYMARIADARYTDALEGSVEVLASTTWDDARLTFPGFFRPIQSITGG